MKGFLRRIRGIIGTGLTWAVGWAGLWASFFLVMRGFGLMENWRFLYPMQVTAGLGFVAGSVFGVVLGILERHRKLEDLSFWRIAMWGGIGGLAIAALEAVPLLPALVMTALGVGSAAGTLAVARRGSEPTLIGGDDPALPSLEGNDDPLLSLEGE